MNVTDIAAAYRRRGIDVSDADVDNAILLEDEWRHVAHRRGLTDADISDASLAQSAIDAALRATRRTATETRLQGALGRVLALNEAAAITVTPEQQRWLASWVAAEPGFGRGDIIEDQLLRAIHDALPADEQVS